MTATSDREQMAYVSAQAADARVNVELDTGDMTPVSYTHLTLPTKA